MNDDSDSMITDLDELQKELEDRGPVALDDLRESNPNFYQLIFEEVIGVLIESCKETDAATRKTAEMQVSARNGETRQQALARVVSSPAFMAACSIRDLSRIESDQLSLSDLVSQLECHAESTRDRTSLTTSMMVSQAHTLDALFHRLIGMAQSAIENGYGRTGVEYFKLATRAQSQCRATLESLTSLGKPVLRQMNIAHGHQQVNNYAADEIPPNELLEDDDG